MLDAGDKAHAREGLDQLLASSKMTPSSEHLFRTLRMSAAPDLMDFFKHAPQIPMMLTYDQDGAQIGFRPDNSDYGDEYRKRFRPTLERLSPEATEAIDRMPYRMLRQLALETSPQPHLHREMLIAALTRGLLLDRDLTDIARRLAEVDPSVGTRAGAIADADRPEAQRFATAHLLLWHPEARPFLKPGISRQTENGILDNYRDNWWCASGIQDEAAFRGVSEIRIHSALTPVFLTEHDLAEAAKEREVVAKTGRGMDYLGAIVLSWAKSHPSDPRVPEALHREIRGARINCDGLRETRINRACFRLLKSRYRNTEWARKTTVL
jgi:hypothetical protein